MRRYILVLSCILLVTPYAYQSSSSSTSGSVELDELSFDKITGKFKASLVKFDVSYPYGDKHEAFVALAKEAKDVDLLVAQVGVKDYGDKENEQLAKKYGATKDNFPVVQLLVQGREEPITFDDTNGFTSDELRRFVRENTDVYLSLPGCVNELDALSVKFMESNKRDRKEILEKVEDIIKTLESEAKTSGKIYKTIMEKILDKGDEFVSAEYERVKKLRSEKISDKKKKDLKTKINILQSFRLFDKKPKQIDEL